MRSRSRSPRSHKDRHHRHERSRSREATRSRYNGPPRDRREERGRRDRSEERMIVRDFPPRSHSREREKYASVERSGRERERRERHARASRRSPPNERSRPRRSRSRSQDRKSEQKSASTKSEVGGAVPKFLLERPKVTDKDLEGKTEEEQEMMKLMGFGGFDSTKGKHVAGNDVSAVNVLQKRKYRQYMNRKGGFNRPLDFCA